MAPDPEVCERRESASMSDLYLVLAIGGGLLLILGMLTGFVREIGIVSEPLLALLAGVLVGPGVLGFFDLAGLGDRRTIMEGVTLLTLAIALMGVALRLPIGYTIRNWRLLLVLLGLVMPLMWLMCGLLAYLILGLSFWVALIVGAVLTPTDPVVANSIVTGGVAERNLPEELRHAISAESGFNDGLAFPFVMLPVLVLAHPPGEALVDWLTRTMLWEVGAGAALGAAISYTASKALKWAETRKTAERTSLLSISLALALTVVGIVELVGLNGVLAAFVAGVVFNNVASSDVREQQEEVQEAITRFFDLPVFVLLGIVLPWEGWLSLGWGGVILAVAVLLLRRLPVVLVLRPLLKPLRSKRDVLFFGWFGPIGAAALYYATFSSLETGREEIWVIGSLVVFASVFAHGVTDSPLTKLYGRLATGDSGQEDDGGSRQNEAHAG